MQKKSGHIEILTITVFLSIVSIILVVVTRDIRGLVIVTIIAALIMAFFIFILISILGSKGGEEGLRTLDDFLDKSAEELDEITGVSLSEAKKAIELGLNSVADNDLELTTAIVANAPSAEHNYGVR